MSKESIVALRRTTGASITDIQKALEEAGNDETKALEVLRKRGQAKAQKKQDRATNEGLVHAYVHGNGGVGVLVEVGCETDFVARNEDFQQFVHDIALQVAATSPLYLSIDDVPQEIIEKEKEIKRAELEGSGKLAGKEEEMINNILNGAMKKFYDEMVLLEQSSIKDDSRKIKELVTDITAKVGENIKIKRFVRYVLGEVE